MAIKKSSKSTAPKSITMDQIKASQGVTASNPSGISRDQLAERAQSIVKNTSSSGRTSTGITKPVSSGGLSGLAGKTGPTGIKTPVTTSDSARSTYDAMRDRIAKMANNTGNYSAVYNNPLYQETSGLIKDQRKSLAERKTAEIGRITADFNQRAEGQKQTQRSETGTQSMSLARIGGFDSASGQGVLTNLQRVHESEQNALMQARQSAILQAQQAYEDKDFALAKMQMDEAKATEAMLYNRQQDFLKNTLAIRGEERADAQIEYQRMRDERQDAKAALEFSMQYGIDKPFFVVGGIGYDTSTGEKLSFEEFIARGGKEDFSNAAIITPGSLEDKAFVQKLRNDYPDAGITSQDTAEEAQAKLANSRMYRKDTYIAPVGGISGAKTSKQADVIQRARAALQAEAASSKDGKGNPDTYRNFISEYIQADGNTNDFYGAVSLDQFIAPQNRVGDLAGTSIQYQQLKNGGMTPEQQAARKAELLNKVENGTASLAELDELQSLR